MIFGAHVSTEGGLAAAFARAEEAGCDAFQIFTRNRAAWKSRALGEEQVRAWRSRWKASTISRVVAHASYLLNIASPAKDLRRRSADALRDELERCEALGIPFLVLHPGSHMGAGEAEGLERAAESIDRVHAATRGFRARILIETSPGHGSSVCHRFESLGALLRMVADPERLGACVDTCHIFAAGYELRTEKGYAATLEALDREIGIDKVSCIHVNDSKRELGSRVDRHEYIGKGCLGLRAFRRLVNDGRLEKIPLILEISPGPRNDKNKENLEVLRSLVRGPVGRAKK